MCTRPIEAWQSDELLDNFKHKVVFKAHSSDPFTEGRFHFNRQILIPCGKCLDCRLKKSYQWADRIMLESEQYTFNCFITLTYDDIHMPLLNVDDRMVGTLVKRDLQLFMKRLRKDLYPRKIRFFACGEYGSKTNRPHYHIIIFNYFPEDAMKWSENDDYVLYRSKRIERLWNKGQSVVGSLVPTSARYVASYMLKKQYETTKEYKVQAPFITMSKRPGLGMNYYLSHKDDILNGSMIYPPLSKPCQSLTAFDRKIEQEDPNALFRLKLARQDLNAVLDDGIPSFDKKSLYDEKERKLERNNIRKESFR